MGLIASVPSIRYVPSVPPDLPPAVPPPLPPQTRHPTWRKGLRSILADGSGTGSDGGSSEVPVALMAGAMADLHSI